MKTLLYLSLLITLASCTQIPKTANNISKTTSECNCSKYLTQKLICEKNDEVFVDLNSSPILETNSSQVRLCKDEVIDDLKTYPQNIKGYIDNFKSTNYNANLDMFEKKYFMPWSIDKAPQSLESIKWPFSSYTKKQMYVENLQEVDKYFFKNMLDKSNFKNFDKVRKYGITLRFTSLRNFPTSKPLFKDPKLAGEGFPFDYVQNSSIHPNEPIYISHYSKDKAWVYVFTSYATGWIKSHEFAYIDKEYTQKIKKAKLVFITNDNLNVYDKNDNYMFNGKIGMMLPLVKVNKSSYDVLAISKGKGNKAIFNTVEISKDKSSLGELKLTKNNLLKIISPMFYVNYGWGGLYNERDCSSTLRDIFAPFGIWLPRNSFQQSKYGKIIKLSKFSKEKKLEKIKKLAIPFETIIYRKGHILLYLGTYNGKVVVLHNVWGVKTKKDGIYGRHVIGKTIVSTLELGSNLSDYYEKSSLINGTVSMSILTDK